MANMPPLMMGPVMPVSLSPCSLPAGAPVKGVPAGIGGKAARSGEKRDAGSLRVHVNLLMHTIPFPGSNPGSRLIRLPRVREVLTRAAGRMGLACLCLAVLAHGAQATEPAKSAEPAESAESAEPLSAPASPLGLDQLIALSLQNHPSIAAARAELGAAQAEIEAARAQYYPTPSVQLQQDKGATATVLRVDQPLWAGGRLDAGLEVAKSRANARQESISEAQYTLALRVAAAWADWVQAQGRIEALGKGVDLLKVYAESVGRRIQGGASAQVDQELVVARLSQTQGELAAARSAERSALARLAQMTGRPLRSENLARQEALGAAERPLPDLDTLIAQAMAHSAALKRLAAEADTARHEIEQRRAALWPTLNLRAQHERSSGTSTSAAFDDSKIMLVLDYAPGAGVSAGANIDAAVARANALHEKLDAARRDLTEIVTADYQDLVASRDRKREFQRTIEANTEVLASYDRLFVAGKRSWLDVINAARDVIQAQTALADVQAQQAAAHARLRIHAGEMP